MDEKKLGPLLSDEQFFGECLNLDYPGMEAVKEAVEAAGGKDYSLARKEMASYIRKTLDADRFFEIPYEIPENIYKLRVRVMPRQQSESAIIRLCLLASLVSTEKKIQLIGKQILHTMAIKNGHGS